MDAYRLVFRLPPILLLRVKSGRHNPCLHGCVLTVERGVVSIEGPSRDQVLAQARRFFRVEAKGLDAFTVAAVLETPRCEEAGIPSGRDSYSVIVNATVAFAATAIEPNIDDARVREITGDRPQLTVISAG